MRRQFTRRVNSVRPSRAWSDISNGWVFAAVTTTSTATLIQLQSPTALSNLTSDPPEDLTVLRIRGEFNVTLAGAAAGNWTLALLVQDTAWTPSTLFSTDSDKRVLWSRTYQATNATADNWFSGGTYLASGSGATAFAGSPNATELDIAPKVRIEAGKALFLVAYENAGTGSLSTLSTSMRALYQRSPRRR